MTATARAAGGTYLLTGVTGFLGKVVLEELLRRRHELGVARVYVPIRHKGEKTAAERFTREVVPSPCFAKLPAGWTDLVSVLDADLEQPNLGLEQGQVPLDVTHIVHSAASVSFDLPVHEAARSNVVTTLNVLGLAKTLPRLQRFVAVSTAYVTPAKGGPVTVAPEELVPLPKPASELFDAIRQPVGQRAERRLLELTGHPNTYTLTKCIAEHLLLERKGDIPVTIVRPSIISASLHHPFPGWIDSKAGFAGFVVLLGAGHLRAVVGHGDSKLDLVPVDVVSDRIVDACTGKPGPTVRYATAGLAHSPTINECWGGIQRFYHLNRVHRKPMLRYIGPRDVKFRMADALHHGLPIALGSLPGTKTRRKSKSLGSRLDHVNRAFPYFTSNTFDFQCSTGLEAGFDREHYVQVVCRGVHRHVLRADNAQWPMAGAKHLGHGGDLAWSMSQPAGNGWIRAASWVVTKVLRKTMDQVTVDVSSFEHARTNTPQDSGIVIVATHRSYLDFVLVSYLAFARPDIGLPIPHIAATMEFGKIPVLGRILRSMHAFYLRRGGGKEDPELTRRVSELMSDDKALEFFIEGQRSRTREFLEPKRGLLRAIQSTGKPVTILPIALTYDRVPEERAFAQELAGAPKPKMRLGSLLGWTAKALRGKVRLGRVHIACGKPIHLTSASDVHAVSQQIMRELRAATVTTTFHLKAVLAHDPRPGEDLESLRAAIQTAGGKVVESALEVPADLDPRVAATMRNQFAHLLGPDNVRVSAKPASRAAVEVTVRGRKP